jgi:LPS-assembly protein
MANSSPTFLIRFALLGLSCSPVIALDQTHWMECPVPPDPISRINRPDDLPPDAVYIEANQALLRDEGISEMNGNVHVSQNEKKMRADKATYDKASSQVTGTGNIYFQSAGMNARGSKLDYNLNKDSGTLDDADYHLTDTGTDGRGTSKKVTRKNENFTHLEQASYTTCPPGKNDWSINSPNIRLYHDQDRGVATNVTLKVHKTPILYLPYMSFPLSDKRKSGFLIPSIGSTGKSGAELSTPYYFNLAPNYDMTLTPTLLSKRGIQLGTEFRYLTQDSNGTINYTILPNDRASDKNNRYYFNVKDKTRLGSRSSLSLQAEGVSDSKYFVDLGNSLQATSTVNLERRLDYATSGDNWTFSALTQNYQVLDGGTKPHSRLPQLVFNYRPRISNNGIKVDTETELTRFSGSETVTNGSRLDLKAKVSKRFSTEAAYIEPSVTLRHTEYSLDNGSNTHLSRTLPTATLDTGLFFERNIQQGKYLQTLEPRLYYTRTPYKDQNSIPVFDSSATTFSYGQLFSENRFTGKDRVEDANRLSASVTSRIQDQQNGKELFHASLGQIYHFGDRKVTMPGEAIQTGKRSEIVLETGGQINDKVNVGSTTFWDSSTKQLTANQVDVRYKDDKKRILNVGYTKRVNDFETTRLSFVAPVKQQWKMVGGVEHDLMNKRNLENVLGAEYESCCWKTRVVSRNYLLPDNKTRDNAVFIEFELKGLGKFGSGGRDLLRDRIYNYDE